MLGFMAKFGMDTVDFSRGLDSLVPMARVAQSKLEAVFENGQERRKRAIRKTFRFMKDRSQSFNKAWLAATAASAVGVGVLTSSLALAAERSDRVRLTLDGIASAKNDLLADIGAETSLLGGGFESWIRGVNTFRKTWSNGWADIFSLSKGHGAEIDRILEIEQRQTKEIKVQRDLEKEMLALKAAAGDLDARDQLALKRKQESLNGSLFTLQQQREILDQFTANQRNARATNQGDARSFGDQAAQLELSVLSARAKSAAEEIQLAKRSAAEEERLAIRTIREDTKLSEDEQRDLIDRTTWAIKERTDTRIREIKETEQARAANAKRQIADQIKSNEIELMRLGGQEKQAEALRIQEETTRRIRDIRQGEGSDADKIRAIESERGLGIARLRGINGSGSGSDGIAAGFFGGATSRLQTLGAAGNGNGGQDPTTKAVRDSISVLERIEELLDNNNAGSGPVVV